MNVSYYKNNQTSVTELSNPASVEGGRKIGKAYTDDTHNEKVDKLPTGLSLKQRLPIEPMACSKAFKGRFKTGEGEPIITHH